MLTYTSKELNRNFKVVVFGEFNGQKIRTLVGFSGLRSYVNDDDLLERLLDRAFSTRKDMELCKLRRGLRFAFYRF